MFIEIDTKRNYAVVIVFLSVMASGNTEGQLRADESDPPKLSCRVIVPAKSAAADANVTEVSNLEWIRVEIQLSGGGLALAKMIVDLAANSTYVRGKATVEIAVSRLDGGDRSRVPVKLWYSGGGQKAGTRRLSLLMEIPISRERREQNIEAYLKQVDAASAKWFARLDSGEIKLDPEMRRLYKLMGKQYKQKRESGEFAAMFGERYYMENQVGTFELHCRYFADQAGFWAGEVQSKPLSFVVRDDGNNFDKPGFKIHEGPQ